MSSRKGSNRSLDFNRQANTTCDADLRPTTMLPCVTVSIAYSTWISRPCGLNVVQSLSYWLVFIAGNRGLGLAQICHKILVNALLRRINNAPRKCARTATAFGCFCHQSQVGNVLFYHDGFSRTKQSEIDVVLQTIFFKHAAGKH